MQKSKDHNALSEEQAINRKKAQKLAEKHSPDLSKLIRIQLNRDTHLFVTPEKYEAKGEEYFRKKYKREVRKE